MKLKKPMIIFHPAVIAALLTLFASYFSVRAYFRDKAENEEANKNLKNAVIDAKDQSVKKIDSVANEIVDSLLLTAQDITKELKLKTAELGKSIDLVNQEVNQTARNISDGIESLKNPLEPLQIEINFSINYSNCDSTHLQFIENYRRYIQSLGSYTDNIIPLCQSKKLPNLIIHYDDDGNVKNIKNIEAFFRPYDNSNPEYLTQFKIAEINLFLAFLPSGFMFLNSENRGFDLARFNSDLSFEFGANSSKGKIEEKIEYHIDYKKNEIRFIIKCKDPLITRTSGSIHGLKDCKNGNLGIGFNVIPGVEYLINSMSLNYSKDYRLKKTFPFSNIRPRKIFNDEIFVISSNALSKLL